MPFASKAQRGYLWANRPDLAREFQSATPKGKKLPARVHNRKVKRLDPTRTATIRRVMLEDLRRRFARLRLVVRQLVVGDNAFGFTANAFCATGPGGGVDPSCGKDGAGVVAGFRAARAAVKSLPVLKQLDAAQGAMRKVVGKFKAGLEARYGKPAAYAILASGQALGWGATAAGAAFGVPVWLPGSTLWGAVPAVALAEAIKQGARLARREPTRNVDVAAEGKRLAEALHRAYLGYLEQNKAMILAAHAAPVANDLGDKERFTFHTDANKLQAFRAWLKKQLNVVGLTDLEVWQRYVEAGYRKGAGRAFDDTNKARVPPAGIKAPGDFHRGTRAEFLRSSFAQPVAIEKVQHLAERTYTDLVGVTDDMAVRMSRTLSDGLVKGQSPLTVAKELADDLDISQGRAELIARTECLPADALVDAAMVRAVFRRRYVGDLVEIETRSGCKLSATPNHPMLTQRGWVAAGAIQEGDCLIRDGRQQDASALHDPNVKTGPATIGEIFNSLQAVAILERRSCAEPDFHGDGRDGKVDVLVPDGGLRVGRDPALKKPVAENALSPADKVLQSCFCPLCGSLLPVDQRACFVCGAKCNTQLLKSAGNPSPVQAGCVAERHERLTGLVSVGQFGGIYIGAELVADSALIPGQALSLTDGSTDTGRTENDADRLLVAPEGVGDLSLGHALAIELDDVLAVRIRPFSGHVFNLETRDGYYTTQGYYTGNCIRAHAEGQLDALENLGVEAVGVQVEWLVTEDDSLCPECAAMADAVFSIEEARGMIPLHPNAVFAGSTFVPYGEALEIVRAWYSGPAVILTLRGGQHRTTIGPNHPILTRRGMVRAADIHEGDEILYDLRQDVSRRVGHEANLKKIPAVQDVFATCLSVGNHTRIAASSSDLHGDRVHCQGEVQAIWPARNLLKVWDSRGVEVLRENALMRAYSNALPMARLGSPALFGVGADAPLYGPMGGGNLLQSLGRGHACPFDAFRPRLTSPHDAIDNEAPADYPAVNADVFGDRIFGFAAQIPIYDFFVWEKVHSVSMSTYQGWAFDGTTDTSLYCSDGFVVSNCRCAFAPAIPDELTQNSARHLHLSEWRAAHIWNRSFFADCERDPKGRCLPGVGEKQLAKVQGKALAKVAAAPVPTKAERAAANKRIDTMGADRYEADIRGNSYSRKASRERMLKEFGDGHTCPCVYCGTTLDDSTITRDKIFTARQGGRYRHENLLPACLSCNKRRGDVPIGEVQWSQHEHAHKH